MLFDQDEVQSGCALPHTVNTPGEIAGVPTIVVGATPC